MFALPKNYCHQRKPMLTEWYKKGRRNHTIEGNYSIIKHAFVQWASKMHFNSVTGGNECSVFCLKASGKKRVYASIMSLVELGKRLLDAAKRGDTDEVRSLMSNGAPFTTDWLGMSPLHFAARNGHIQTAEVLLRAGISRDARTKVDRTPLHVASQEGHLTLVELLLQNSADIEARDMLRMTPLHWATEKGHVAIIELLLKNGADATCEDKFDRTTLDIANGNDRTDLIQMLQFGQQQQNSDITGITEGETVTVETTETVTTTSNDLQEIVTTSTSQTPTTPSAPIIITKGNASPTQILPVTVIPSKSPENSSDPSSTSVLATLAVLAEATAPFNAQNPSTAEAMSWLESHGITMISTNDGSIITSAMESGQSIALTEAGKMALNIIKQQGLNRTTSDGETQDSAVDSAIENVVGDTGEQKVITIVTTDQNQVTSSGSDNSVLVAVSADVVTDSSIETERDSEEPLAKKSRLDSGDGDQDVTAGVVDLTQILHTKESRDGLDKDELRRQLEEVQRQADAYKLQLRQKELEAEVYKKQLSEITTNKLDMK